MKEVAHHNGAKVNDVVLELAAAGLRAALPGRGRRVEGVTLKALVAVDPRAPRNRPGHRNVAGSVVVRLPLGGASSLERLHAIAAATRRLRRRQSAAALEVFMVAVALSRLGRLLSRRQPIVSLAVSDLAGPAARLSLLGCPVIDAIPFTPINGNVTIAFCALSYAGLFNIGLLADADSWPDLDTLVDGMKESWAALQESVGNRPNTPQLGPQATVFERRA